jgi:hypothetical protein
MKTEINYLGLTVIPLKLSYEFYRDTRKNGKPKTMVLGGVVEAELEANYETMRFLEEMLTIDERHKNWNLQSPTDRESYKKILIKIYDSEDYNIRTLELLDTYIADFEEVFETVKEHIKNGETNNYVKLKFRSASQIINKGITKNVFGWWLTNPFIKDEYKSPVNVVEEKEEKKQYRKYQIDSNGNISLCEGKKENVRDYDILINQKGEEIKINDTSILPELTEIKEISKSSYHGLKRLSTAIRGEDSQNDLFKIFNFASNNTNVEWSLTRANINMFGIGTYHNQSLSPGYVGLFKAENVVAEIHSHPNIPTSLKEEKGEFTRR